MNFKVQRSRAHERITVALNHVNVDISISFEPDLHRSLPIVVFSIQILCAENPLLPMYYKSQYVLKCNIEQLSDIVRSYNFFTLNICYL